MLFKLYENKSVSDVEIKSVHEVELVLSLSNQSAMLLANWFYREDGDKLKYDFNESNHFISVTGGVLLDVIKGLESIFDEEDVYQRNLNALLLFPVGNGVLNCDVGMWSSVYYGHLREVYSALKSVVGEDGVSNRERLFYYNVKW